MFETFQEDLVQVGGFELLEAVNAEFRRGWEVRKALVLAQQQRMATACTTLESSAIDGLGYIDSDIPDDVYFYWINEGRKRGVNNIWKFQEFRRDVLRDNPQYRVRYRKRAMSGWATPALADAARDARAARQSTLISLS